MKKITLLTAFFAVLTMNAQIFSEDFEDGAVDDTTYTQWDSIDEDGDGNFWEVADMLDYANGSSGAINHPMQTLAADSDSWETAPGGLNPDNFLITKEPIDLSNSTGTTLTYTVGSYQVNGTFLEDKYSIYLTVSNDPLDISDSTPIVTNLVQDVAACDQADGSASAVTLIEDISAFDGQQVYLTFRHYDTFDHNSVLIDDIIVDGILSTEDEVFNSFAYLVENNEMLILSSKNVLESVQIYNVLGQEVVNQKLASTDGKITISNLNSGVYIVKVASEGQIKSFKISKK